MRILTQEEHKKYKHLCDFTGDELDAKKGQCSKCREENLKQWMECGESHAVLGWDAEARLEYEKRIRGYQV